MEIAGGDNQPHRFGLMSCVKGGQQGKGSHAHKGRGAGEARPCSAGAQARQGLASAAPIPPFERQVTDSMPCKAISLSASIGHQKAMSDG